MRQLFSLGASTDGMNRKQWSGSTDSAVGDTAQDVFYFAGSKFGIDGGNWGDAAKCAVGTLEPVHRTFVIA